MHAIREREMAIPEHAHGCKIQRFFSHVINENFSGLFCFYIFLIFAQNIDCGYTFEPPGWGGSNEYPQSMF